MLVNARQKINRNHQLQSKLIVIFAMMILFITSFDLSAQDSSKINPQFLRDKNFSPYQIIKGDTAALRLKRYEPTARPGAINGVFSADQDSAYYRALKLHVPFSARINNDIRLFTDNAVKDGLYKDLWENARHNMIIPAEFFVPSAQQVVSHQYNLAQAQSVPYINTIPKLTLGISFETLGKFFGWIEDVSPTIKYELDYTSEVEIVIYSAQASVIATILAATQPTGSYSVTWNGRDEKGMVMSPGDYVAEVRIGKYRYVRKRIVIYK